MAQLHPDVISSGDLSKLAEIIEPLSENERFNCLTEPTELNPRNCLQSAAESDSPNTLLYLLKSLSLSDKKKCEVLGLNSVEETPLSIAASRGSIAVVKALMEYVDAADSFSLLSQASGDYLASPLSYALGHPEVICFLLNCVTEQERATLLRQPAASGLTTLTAAITETELESVKAMLDTLTQEHLLSALSAPTVTGDTALMVALQVRSDGITNYILSKVRSLSAEDRMQYLLLANEPGGTALMMASNSVDTLKDLLCLVDGPQRLMLIKQRNSVGGSVLHIAADEGNAAATQLLLSEAGDSSQQRLALLSMQNNVGGTPLMIATQFGHIAYIYSLFAELSYEEMLSTLTQQNAVGGNALMIAAEQGRTEVMVALSEKVRKSEKLGVFSYRNRQGGTPLMIASEQQNLSMIKWIMDFMSNDDERIALTNAKNNLEGTAYSIAMSLGNQQICEYLRPHVSMKYIDELTEGVEAINMEDGSTAETSGQKCVLL